MPQEEAVQSAETQESAVGGETAVQQETAPAAADVKPANIPMSEYVKLRRDPAKTIAPESATGNSQETEEQKAAKEAEKQAEAEKSKGGGWQRKIDKQTKKITQLTEALEAEKLARSTAEARLAGKPAATEPAKEAAKESDIGARPKSTDTNPDGTPKYKSWEEYEDALLDWRMKKDAAARKESESKTTQQTEQEKVFQAHHDRVEAYRKTQTDYNDVMEDMDGEPLRASAGLAIVEMEDGPQILYHLATHPEVREKINGMKSDFQVIAELGRISASLAKTQAQKSPKPQAPPPPAPIEPVGGGQAKSAKPIHELPIREYAKKRGITLRG